eukprot:CAMPEP_0174307308 /NCGR_PEP_ID=MMETSP0810-20121108/1035_1 /TAXON_ID=73025 ORGANISM="Eutreptiella gymnastica-like, Strain CCMP1594" /NCGR_SAMPLE_ID=MMETSP0810 /ASSEMBLY_ACC=CAM_ASM_000659 /LENGTH=433 /DNA_ID=CAMNT_0015414321 /DNA_START=72 /DNA_END=1370 /DNA_ORIENTATION=-
MDFTTAFKFSGISVFSPDGTKLANSAGVRLCIRDVQSLEMIKLHTCVDKIGYLEWSCDSQYVLCMLTGRDIIQIYAVNSIHQVARIDEGNGGLRSVQWLPSGRHVLTLAEHSLRVTIWSLLDKDDIKQIKQPKCDDDQNLIVSFTRDRKYMALVERRGCKDYILVVDIDNFAIVRRWEIDGTSDVQKLELSPDGCRLCCIDGMFTFRALIYALDGKLLSVIAPGKAILGARTLDWSSDGSLLAIGGYDGNCRVVSHISWKAFACLEHPTSISSNTVVVFKEQEYTAKSGEEVRGCKYEICNQPFQLPQRTGASDKASAKLGVKKVAFSCDGLYMCTCDESTPNCVFIWSIRKMCLEAVLVHMKPVKSVQWDPCHTRLGICTGVKRFYLWSPSGCTCVDTVHPEFSVQNFTWNADGCALVLEDKLSFCMAYPAW